MKGIDVSTHQGAIGWPQVKAAGIGFAIIRTGYGWMNKSKQKDKFFEANYSGAGTVGLLRGAYHYSYAMSTSDAILEAEFCLEILAGRTLELPIFCDLEDYSQTKLGRKVLTDIALAFIGRIRAAGRECHLYANPNWLRNYFDTARLSGVDIWLANYSGQNPDSVDRSNECAMWQYSSTGRVAGISGGVDMNVLYKEYSKPIYKSDTTNTDDSPVKIQRGKIYTIKITGEDISLGVGTAGVVQVIRCRREGNATYWHVIPLPDANPGSRAGIYRIGHERVCVVQVL